MKIKKRKKEEAERDKIRRSRKSGAAGWWANGGNQCRSRVIFCLCQTKSGEFDSCRCWVLNICAASCATVCVGCFFFLDNCFLVVYYPSVGSKTWLAVAMRLFKTVSQTSVKPCDLLLERLKCWKSSGPSALCMLSLNVRRMNTTQSCRGLFAFY